MTTITKYDAVTLLIQVTSEQGSIHIESNDADDFTQNLYWTPREIGAVQHLITAYERLKQRRQDASRPKLKVKKLDPDAKLPVRAKELDAGYDICSIVDAKVMPGESVVLSTGIALETPPGTYAAAHPRSGLAARHQVTILNAPGTIDEGYRGEVKVNLINLGGVPFHVIKGNRIAQLIIQKYETPEVIEVTELSDTDRGEAGHGSTGR